MKKRLYLLLAICTLSLFAFTACATEDDNDLNNSATETEMNGTNGTNGTTEPTNGTGTTNGANETAATGGSGTTGDSVPGDVGDAIQDGDIDGLNNNNNE
ncbi:MAG: hypothetical protein K0R92_134 [Lachnospiraceae bacterium]|jgi:hypothetical protein|nr:hypothetical protein [Lachnospiraceae bacterium]